MKNYFSLLGQANEASSGSAEQGPVDAAGPAPGEGAAQSQAPGETETVTQQPGGQEPAPKQQRPPQGLGMWFPLILIFLVMYFLVFRGPKKQQKQHQQMLATMKKNDRVRTIGGIMGTVVDVRDDEIVVKIDEATNTKIHLVRSAISKVYRDGQEVK